MRSAQNLLLAVLTLILAGLSRGQTYDPSAVDPAPAPIQLDLVIRDETRDRDIPVLITLPAPSARAPVILFSHGLGGARHAASYLARHWAARGYVAVFLQHPGSDDGIWRNVAPGKRLSALQEAASGKNLLLRAGDVKTALDYLTEKAAAEDSPLFGRLDLTKVGMAGHSFGAVTAQVVSGQTHPISGLQLKDPRIKAALILSPSSPPGLAAKDAFRSVTIPWLLMTGTRDIGPIGRADMESRLSVYPALPSRPKYELVLAGAQHSAFTDAALPRRDEPRNPQHHRAIQAISTAFWDAFLGGDVAARAWLDGDGPSSVLEQDDRWERELPSCQRPAGE